MSAYALVMAAIASGSKALFLNRRWTAICGAFHTPDGIKRDAELPGRKSPVGFCSAKS
jgi:hypothetical protein